MKAIIIGATSGIGREIAFRLLREGWTAGLAGRRFDALQSVQDEFGKQRVHIAAMDVTRPDATGALDGLLEESGSPDLFLYVSGVGYQNRELDLDKEIRTVRTNSEGMVRMVDHFINYVKAHPGEYGGGRKARIAVVSSVAGTAGLGTAPAYSATKRMQGTYISALAQLSRMERIPVLFTEIRPGFIRTPLLDPGKHYPMTMTLERAVDHIMKGLGRGRRVVTFDWRFRLLVFFWRLIPRCIWERLTFVKT